MTITSTLALKTAGERCWDAIVIGAGPAGAGVAGNIAAAGKHVLLVDAKSFPRRKVCGGCLNLRAWELLGQWGVQPQILQAGAVPLNRLRLACGDRQLSWRLPQQWAISRGELDAILARRAIAAGADFLPATMAFVGRCADEHRSVSLSQSDQPATTALARVVVAADGLTHSSLKSMPTFANPPHAASRIGLAAMFDDRSESYPLGELAMAVGNDGYVGVTRVEHGRLNIAAAVNPMLLQRGGSPGVVVAEILQACHFPLTSDFAAGDWLGSPALTRTSRHVATTRLFLIGDAAGYVEPFTGEGIASALTGAALVTPLVVAGTENWRDALALQWERVFHRSVLRGQWICQLLTTILRSRTATKWTLQACQWLPAIASGAIRYANRPPPAARQAFVGRLNG